MNIVAIVGRTTKDIELNYSQSGIAVAKFTVAVNRKFKNHQGEYEADFIRCLAFKKTAEILANHVQKGNQIGIDGSIQTGSYQNKQGQTVYTTEVLVNNFTFLENKPKNSQNPNTQNKQQQNTLENEGVEITGDDLPF